MKSERKYRGFSLTEVLLAVGTLAIGMIFVAGVFPVGLYFSTVATERTIAAVVADEAFAKIRLYDVDVSSPLLASTTACVDFNDVSGIAPKSIDPNEFAYPSTDSITQKKYYWSALCRRVGARDVQITVFVSRKIGAGTRYWDRDYTLNPPPLIEVDEPVPVYVEVSQNDTDELLIGDLDPTNYPDEETFINDGYTIVDDQTGEIYRVLERYALPDDDKVILLDRDWQGDPMGSIWVVPPPVGGGRYPCIAVYQKVIRF